MPFCVLADVELLLQVKFALDSDPTSTAVEGIISQIDARIRQALVGGGISVPSDAERLAVLKNINAMGAAGLTGMIYGRNFENVNSGQAQWYYGQFLDELKNFVSGYSQSGFNPASTATFSAVGGAMPWKNEVKW